MTVNEITASKAEFALVLTEAGLDVYPYVPARITPPVIVIRHGSPYLQPSSVGNEYSLGLELILLAGTSVNELATETLDQLIQDTLNALPNYAAMDNVTQPQMFTENGADYLGCTISINLDITL
jgi:hypothetical protein